MRGRSGWSRRQFVQMAGSSLGAMSFGMPLPARARGRFATRFAYVGFGGDWAKEEGIAVFDLRGGDLRGERWRQASAVASAAPSSLVLDASERFLYAVN